MDIIPKAPRYGAKTRLANWLFKKYGNLNVAEMTRQQIMGTERRTPYDDLSNSEKRDLKEKCISLLENDAFHFVVDEYVREVEINIIENVNSDTLLLCNRFSINGASDIRERVNLYSRWEHPREESFEKFDAI